MVFKTWTDLRLLKPSSHCVLCDVQCLRKVEKSRGGGKKKSFEGRAFPSSTIKIWGGKDTCPSPPGPPIPPALM